jgi:hypothetical protein
LSYSNACKLAVLEPNSDEVILWLLTLEHPSTSTIYRFVNNLDAVTSRGNSYMAFPFKFILADDDGNTLPQINIEVDNVNRDLMDILRSYADGLTIKAEIVLASQPDTVEYTIEDLVVKSVQYNAQSVTITAQVEDLMNQKFPAHNYLPRSFAGLFK